MRKCYTRNECHDQLKERLKASHLVGGEGGGGDEHNKQKRNVYCDCKTWNNDV